jgi:hypothetical protein
MLRSRIVLLLGLAVSGSLLAPGAAAAGYGMFAECIRNSGAVFYDAHWCGNCVSQRELFRGYANRLKIISCYPPGDSDNIKAVCRSANVRSFPTWIFADGTRRSGMLSAADLARHTGCTPP